jgi:hypothetical protein
MQKRSLFLSILSQGVTEEIWRQRAHDAALFFALNKDSESETNGAANNL